MAIIPSFNFQNLIISSDFLKSSQIWGFYADLEESLGTFETTKLVYERMIDLHVITPQMVINYANFLEENKYFEESFKAFEKGLSLFNFPYSFEIWVAYINKFIERYGGKKLERAREIFEQVLEKCPKKSAKIFFILYANLEEEFGLARHAMNVYNRACTSVPSEDMFGMFCLYIERATEFYGVPKTREIYEKAIECLPDKEAAKMCIRFSELEKRLGEIDRARQILSHGAQMSDPAKNPEYWDSWKSFELEHGNEETFGEFLRIRRSVQSKFNVDINVMASEMKSQIDQGNDFGIPSGLLGDDLKTLENEIEQSQALRKQNISEDDIPKVENPEEIELDEDEDEEEENDFVIEEQSVPDSVIKKNLPKHSK